MTFSIITFRITSLFQCNYDERFIYCCAERHYAECHYAKCRYAECRGVVFESSEAYYTKVEITLREVL